MRYLVLLLLLAGCGQAEKKSVEFGRDEGGQKICATPSFFREGTPPITDPNLLPKGIYRLVSTEAFFQEEGGDLRAHYLEGQRGSEFISRKICSSALPERELLSIPFYGLSEIMNGDTVAYRPVVATIYGEKERFSFSRASPGAVVSGNVAEALAVWGHWAFYRLSDSEYELRLYVFETVRERRIMKLMALRFSFSSAPGSAPRSAAP